MKLSLSARMLQPDDHDMPVPDFVALAKRAGYDGVELRPWQWQWNQKDLVGLVPGDVQVLLTTGEAIGQAFDVASRLGTKLIRADLEPEQLLAAAAKAPRDVRFGPQLHTGGSYETIASAVESLDRAKDSRIGLIVEPANLHLVGAGVSVDALAPLKGRIIGCNLQSLSVGAGPDELTLLDGRKVRYQRTAVGDWTPVRLITLLQSLHSLEFDGVLNVIAPRVAGMSLEEQATTWNRSLRAAIDEAGKGVALNRC